MPIKHILYCDSCKDRHFTITYLKFTYVKSHLSCISLACRQAPDTSQHEPRLTQQVTANPDSPMPNPVLLPGEYFLSLTT